MATRVESHRVHTSRRDGGRVDAPRNERKIDDAPSLGTTKTKDLPGHLPRVTKLEVEGLAKQSAGLKGVKRAEIVAEVELGMPQSGLCHLPSGETIAASDNKGIYEVRPGEDPRLLVKLKDCEGLTVDSKGKFAYAVEEGTRRVHKYEIRHDEKGRLELHDVDEPRKLPKLKSVENKGWEGIAFMPKELAGGKKDCMVCVHEGNPRRIGIYELPDLDTGVTLKLPKGAKDLLPDIADVAVDPKTGHIFVVSDQSRMVVELAITRQTKAATQGLLDTVELSVVSSIDLPLSGKQKPEALRFDELGRLWVGLDNEDDEKKKGKALVLELHR